MNIFACLISPGTLVAFCFKLQFIGHRQNSIECRGLDVLKYFVEDGGLVTEALIGVAAVLYRSKDDKKNTFN